MPLRRSFFGLGVLVLLVNEAALKADEHENGSSLHHACVSGITVLHDTKDTKRTVSKTKLWGTPPMSLDALIYSKVVDKSMLCEGFALPN